MYCDAQVRGVSHINSCSLQLLSVTIRNEKFLNFSVQRGYKKDDAWNEFSILPQVMNTKLVVKDPLSPFIKKLATIMAGWGKNRLLTLALIWETRTLDAYFDWHRLRMRKIHTAGRNWEARHGFIIPYLTDSLHLQSSFFWKGAFP